MDVILFFEFIKVLSGDLNNVLCGPAQPEFKVQIQTRRITIYSFVLQWEYFDLNCPISE